MKKLILAATLISSPALAAPVDFSIELMDQDAKPITECIKVDTIDKTKCLEEVKVTLGRLAKAALDIPEQGMKSSEIVSRGMLSEKIGADKTIDLSVDDAKLIKEQIVKFNYRTSIKFQAIRLIDPQGTAEGK